MIRIAVYLLAGCLALGCSPDATSPHPVNCGRLQEGIITEDRLAVGEEIDRVCHRLAEVNVNSPTLMQQRLDELVAALQSHCGLQVEKLCFACIKTEPAQSELLVRFTRQGSSYRKVIDIVTPEKGRLRFGGMHD